MADRMTETLGQVVRTARGAIEYGETGQGFPVLVIHGAGGGCDQGLLAGQSAQIRAGVRGFLCRALDRYS